MKGGKYAKTLAKIQVGRVYFVYEISGEMFYQIFGDLYGNTMLVPIRMGTNVADGNQQKHLLTSFVTKA